MKYTVLFLDIDGVLNSGNYVKRLNGRFDDPINQIDPDAVKLLNKITDFTGCKIVVTSTWRRAFQCRCADPLRSLQGCLRMYNITGDIIGMTGYLPDAGDDRRGMEIQEWLDANGHEVEKFVVVDDDSADIAHLKPHLIKTIFEDGLQDSHVQKIISILGMSL